LEEKRKGGEDYTDDQRAGEENESKEEKQSIGDGLV
jgi:hypothetical protein